MIFEFVIVYQGEEGTPIRDVLTERISRVLSDNLNEFDFYAIERMVRVNYERRPPLVDGEIPPSGQLAVSGFTLELPDETASARTVIDDFVDALRAAPIEHVVKFEDPLLRRELAQRAEELFVLEMKLRRVLSVIYVHAYRDQLYDLLREETVKPMNPAPEEHMQDVAENEFFFLTFGQYVGLNHRPDMTKLPFLVDLIRNNETYEALRTELERLPVEDEDDAVFLASLKERMDPIEAMRNCVAHNRRPSKRATDNYLNARPQVEQDLDDLLTRWSQAWQDEMDDGEMPWDTAARMAVEQAMESAEWDEEAKTIILADADEPRMSMTVSSREELENCLRDVADAAFYVNVPWEDGESVFECYEDGVVEDVLSEYEDQLAAFFAEADEGEAAT